jgi:ketosteroid isomerase-like protein
VPAPASPEILARVAENYEWWNGGEPQLMLGEYTEDAELDISRVFADTPPLHGHEAMRRQITEWYEAWEGVRMDPVEVIELDGGRFVVEIRMWGKGRRSGAEVDQRFAFIYTVREPDNLIVRAQLFPNAQDAQDFASGSADL